MKKTIFIFCFVIIGLSFVSGQGVETCLISKNGSICQEYPSSECSSKCDGACFPAPREETSYCKLGTCYDADFGKCLTQSPSGECTERGGIWNPDPFGNIPECQKACCVVGDNVVPLVTSRECEKMGETSGIATSYRPEIKNGDGCLALARTKVEGACVFTSSEEKKCKFLTKEECLSSSGEFREGILCTNPDLGMEYKKQATAKCVEGKDQIYWFDSQGNRENIYDANKAKSWNNGRVLSETESCDLGDVSNSLNNKKTCGNCNRLLGSVCGQKTSSEKLSDNSIDFVCRDMRCVDKDGKERENGESWCEYRGAIGLDKGAGEFERSVDTPGSRHFRNICTNGEIIPEPCEDYRSEICVQGEKEIETGTKENFAECIVNKGGNCYSYNKANEKGGMALEEEKDLEQCKADPFCFVKEIKVDKDFHFSVCAPKYPPGFNFGESNEKAAETCKIASQQCIALYTKNYLAEWECISNCECKKSKFAEQMNDLCMSLGDCGASVNYEGDLTLNYKVKGGAEIDENYISKLMEYSNPIKDKFIENVFLEESKSETNNFTAASYSGRRLGGERDRMRLLAYLGIYPPGPAAVWSGLGDTKKRVVKFECLPWQPPFGGAKCGDCGSGNFSCSKYACESLGTTCKFVNEGSVDEACIDTNPAEITPPKISPWQEALEEGFSYSDISSNSVKINGPNECLKEYSTFSFGIELDKEGYCAYDFEHRENYTDMLFQGFDSRNTLRKTHRQILAIPSLSSLGVPQYEMGRKAEFNIFIRCVNVNGFVKDSEEYIMNLCVIPEEDKFAPFITGRNPLREEVAFDASSLEGSVITNEPADCRWSLVDNSYDLMENEFNCANSVSERELNGWRCSSEFLIEKDENIFYVRCNDQPWEADVDESKRNAMVLGYQFIVNKTTDPLIIESLSPNNETLIFGVQPASGVLEVKTSGGVDNGRATCFLFEEKPGNEMYETFLTIHKQPLNLYQGNYNFPVVCVDSVKNRVEGLSNFDVKLDVLPPVITRIYGQDGNLIVITDEEAECAFVKSDDYDCDFEFVNGSLMSGSGQYHSSSFDSDITHYIKCKDKYDISQGDCGAIIRGAEIR